MSYFESILDKDGNPTGAHIPRPDWYVPGQPELKYVPAKTTSGGGFSSGVYVGKGQRPLYQYYSTTPEGDYGRVTRDWFNKNMVAAGNDPVTGPYDSVSQSVDDAYTASHSSLADIGGATGKAVDTIKSFLTGDVPNVDAFISNIIDVYGANKVNSLSRNDLIALWQKSHEGTSPIAKSNYIHFGGNDYLLGSDGQYYGNGNPTGYYLQGSNQIVYNGNNPDLAKYKGQVVGTIDDNGNAIYIWT